MGSVVTPQGGGAQEEQDSSHQPHPLAAVPGAGEEGGSGLGVSEDADGGHVETDSEDDDSTEGDGEDGKVLSSERPPESNRGSDAGADKTTPPLTEYIINVVHFLDAILSNNSTDDHMREFIGQGGLEPLLKLLSLPILPLDFPTSSACTAITGACRSIMVSGWGVLLIDPIIPPLPSPPPPLSPSQAYLPLP